VFWGNIAERERHEAKMRENSRKGEKKFKGATRSNFSEI
jgi:hypothetical protein